MSMQFTKDMHLDEILKTVQEADARHVFAQPVEKYGKTLIPVGKVRCGYGYGYGPQKGNCKKSAEDTEHSDENSGGGGAGFKIKPVGYILITPSETKFVKISTFSAKSALVGAALFKMGIVFALSLAGIAAMKYKCMQDELE